MSSARGWGAAAWARCTPRFDRDLGRELSLKVLGSPRAEDAARERVETTLHMRCLAACARLRYGESSGGVFFARLVDEAQSELLQLGVRRPGALVARVFQLFERERADEMTVFTQS